MSAFTLEGAAVKRGRMHIPAWGRYWADVELSTELELDTGDAVTVELVDGITFAMAVVAGGEHEGRSAYRLVAGTGGWSRQLPARGYTSDFGVEANKVLTDAAAEAGETIEGASSLGRSGPHYTRAVGPASTALNGLAPQNWYVDFAGVTQIGQRAPTEFEGESVEINVDDAGRYVELAIEDATGLVPGVQVDGRAPASDVEFSLDGERLTARVYSSPRVTRRTAAYAAIFEALDPWRQFRSTAEYRVISQTGDRLNLQIVRAATGLPDLTNVPSRPHPGVTADYLPGALVLVTFIDGDPSRPCVIAGDAPDQVGWTPLFLYLNGPKAGNLGVAYQGSPVIAGAFAGTVTLGALRTKVSPT